jgi:cellulose synthase/poly-beta-1,6-N-acetylglucosamine synthase-like glycosyltransferase
LAKNFPPAAAYLCRVISLLLFLLLTFCLLGVVTTYVIYPAWVVRRMEKGPYYQLMTERGEGRLPQVSILMAVHNEEVVLREKMESLLAQDYAGDLKIYVGSDCSTDATNEILAAYAHRHPHLRVSYFQDRQGKPGVVNQLAELAGKEGVYVLTDASVMLAPETISALVDPFRIDDQIGVVDATMIQTGARTEGIGQTESRYISREVQIKRAEGARWGAMAGPFGGCWALRASAYQPVPDNFLVDDFFLCMSAYEAGWKGIVSDRAVVHESVGQEIKEEFRRKVRISSGNWQNLHRFRALWSSPGKSPLAFVLFNHKVLRWWTPFFMLIGAMAWLGLIVQTGNYWATLTFALVCGTMVLAVLLDWLLGRLGIHWTSVRALRYFIAMNAALLVGFWRYLTGIRSNVWQPTQRH